MRRWQTYINIYKEECKERSGDEDSVYFIIKAVFGFSLSFSGLIIVIAGSITGIFQLYSIIYPKIEPDRELEAYDSALACIKRSCSVESAKVCAFLFEKKFPNSENFASLQKEAKNFQSHDGCLTPAPVVPVYPIAPVAPVVPINPDEKIGQIQPSKPAVISPDDAKKATLRLWYEKGFTASSLRDIPIFINSDDGDSKTIVMTKSIINRLSKMQMNIVEKEQNAAVIVDLKVIDINTVQTGGKTGYNHYYTEYRADISYSIVVRWFNGDAIYSDFGLSAYAVGREGEVSGAALEKAVVAAASAVLNSVRK